MREFARARLSISEARRGVFQRDLLAVRDWLGTTAVSHSPNRRILKDLVDSGIGRLALTDGAIAQLPDTYRAAREAYRSGAFAVAADSPATSVLDTDLYDPDGQWVCLGNADGSPVARTHADFFHGRSVFHVFLSVPGGRSSGVALLTRLRRDFGHLSIADFHRIFSGEPQDPSRAKVPAGTELALVRRAVLVNNSGRRVVTQLVESIHVQRYGEHRASARLELSRKALFGGGNRGLKLLTLADRRQSTFILHRGDPFEALTSRAPSRTDSYLGDGALEGCPACHEGADLLSILSLSRFRFGSMSSRVPTLIQSTPIFETLAQVKLDHKTK